MECVTICQQAQTAHHLYVESEEFAEYREEAKEHAVAEVSELFPKGQLEPLQRELVGVARGLFSDGEVWPAGYAAFYLGRIPNLYPSLDRRANDMDDIQAKKLHQNIAMKLHTVAIRLTGRIWGKLMRDRTRKWGREIRKEFCY